MSETKRFFRGEWNDDGVYYTVVARDIEHAKDIMRESGMEFGDLSTSYDEADALFEWWELSPEKVAATRCNLDKDNQSIPLAECNLGESFCSEW